MSICMYVRKLHAADAWVFRWQELPANGAQNLMKIIIICSEMLALNENGVYAFYGRCGAHDKRCKCVVMQTPMRIHTHMVDGVCWSEESKKNKQVNNKCIFKWVTHTHMSADLWALKREYEVQATIKPLENC